MGAVNDCLTQVVIASEVDSKILKRKKRWKKWKKRKKKKQKKETTPLAVNKANAFHYLIRLPIQLGRDMRMRQRKY